MSIVTQYDVEMWLRTERALGRKLPELEGVVKDEVMVLAERVGEAQRVAVKEMKELHEGRGKRGAVLKGRRRPGLGIGKKVRDDMDQEEG